MFRSRAAVPQGGQTWMQRSPAASGGQLQPAFVSQRSHRRYVSRGSCRPHTPHGKAMSYRHVQDASRRHSEGDFGTAISCTCLSRPQAGRGLGRRRLSPIGCYPVVSNFACHLQIKRQHRTPLPSNCLSATARWPRRHLRVEWPQHVQRLHTHIMPGRGWKPLQNVWL